MIRFGRWSGNTDPAAPSAQEVFAALPTVSLVIDPAGRIVDVNTAAEAFFNSSRSLLVGREPDEIFGHDLEALRRNDPIAAYDLEISLPGKPNQRVDLIVAPLADHFGWRVLTIHSRSRSNVGRRADREGGALSAIGAAAMLAHEIKNPLSGIRGAAQLLETSVEPGMSAMTRLIRDEVDRIAKLIDRMQDFTDTRPVELSSQNIHSILGHAKDVARQGFAANVTIREVYDPSLPPVLGHRDSLVQVFINLLKNAVEAMQHYNPEGEIILKTSYRSGLSLRRGPGAKPLVLPIEVCVMDDGPGAPTHIAEHLFDPFVTSKKSGSGLGLALVDKLVADQGATIEYSREGLPEKTVFRLLLARAPDKKKSGETA